MCFSGHVNQNVLLGFRFAKTLIFQLVLHLVNRIWLNLPRSIDALSVFYQACLFTADLSMWLMELKLTLWASCSREPLFHTRQMDKHQTKWFLCATMLCRQQNKMFHAGELTAGVASQAADTNSFRAPGLSSGFKGFMNVHHGTLLCQFFCILHT